MDAFPMSVCWIWLTNIVQYWPPIPSSLEVLQAQPIWPPGSWNATFLDITGAYSNIEWCFDTCINENNYIFAIAYPGAHALHASACVH